MAKKPTLTPEEARQEALKTALETIERKFGQGAVMKLSDDVHVKVPVIPTGSIGVDLALGIGGIPKGRVTEIYGPESSGKTTLTLHVIAECQKLGGTAAFIDAEHALDVTYARRLGVKTDELLISHYPFTSLLSPFHRPSPIYEQERRKLVTKMAGDYYSGSSVTSPWDNS